MILLTSLIAILAAYLLGSISFAVVVTRLMGIQDPRTFGSGNPGATNVLRSGNKKAAALTLLFDLLKGAVAVVIAIWLTPLLNWPSYVVPAVSLAVFVGHLFPIYFSFKGGKGVATATGILLAIEPLMGLALFTTWVIIVVITRYSSLAALITAALAPLYYYLFAKGHIDLPMVAAIAAMSVLLIYRHKKNIKNLIAGIETKVGQKKKDTSEEIQEEGDK